MLNPLISPPPEQVPNPNTKVTSGVSLYTLATFFIQISGLGTVAFPG